MPGDKLQYTVPNDEQVGTPAPTIAALGQTILVIQRNRSTKGRSTHFVSPNLGLRQLNNQPANPQIEALAATTRAI